MIFLEAILVAVLILLLINASISDLKSGVVSNKTILIALGVGTPVAATYYAFFATDCLISYAVNIGICVTISIILYAMGIWGAGDSKLFSAVIILLPARLYSISNRSIASCFLMIATIFIVAFVYVIGETLIVGIKQKDLFKLQKVKPDWVGFIRGFLFYYLLLSIINVCLYFLLPDSILIDNTFMTAIHFVVILIGMELEKRTTWIHIFLMGATWITAIIIGLSSFNLSQINISAYLIVIVLMVFRAIANKYNYKTILVEELNPGMILSSGSIVGFAGSKVKGLPTFSTEDLKSRLTKDEVESIERWSKTKNGHETITIIRKIPFALFIGIGTVLYAVMEVVLA